MAEPLRSGEGEVILDLDFTSIDRRKMLMDAASYYNRPELLSLMIARTPASHVHERAVRPAKGDDSGTEEKYVVGYAAVQPQGLRQGLRLSLGTEILAREAQWQQRGPSLSLRDVRIAL